MLASLACGGCRGGGTIHLIPLGVGKISTSKPLVVRMTPDECAFWINDDDALCIAMREAQRSVLGKRFGREFDLSLVLPGPPAASARQYRVNRHTLRARRRAGYSHARFASLVGIVALWDYDGRRVRGRFRISAKKQTYSVLTGWSGNKRVLLVGDFDAVCRPDAARRILARTEEDGLERAGAKHIKPVPVMGPPRRPAGSVEPVGRSSRGTRSSRPN